MAHPNWKPLENKLQADQMNDWMWMGTVEHGSHTIEQYKHCDTRKYLNLDQDGQAWRVRFAGSETPEAVRVDFDDALREATR